MKPLPQTAALLAVAGLASCAACGRQAALPGAGDAQAPASVLVVISSHGLDLSNPAGADMFLRRLDAAINRACDDRRKAGAFALTRSPEFHACRVKALDTAMASVRAPVVRQRYAEQRRSEDLRLAHR